MSPEQLAVFASLGGAVIGALPSIISSLINKNADNKKHFNDLVVKAATENWKYIAEHGKSRAMLPLEHYIIHTAKMCELAFSDKKLTPESTQKHLDEVQGIMDVLIKHSHSISRKT